jgi:phage gp46-like protein
MTDLKLTWDAGLTSADLSVENNDLVTDDGLQTAIMLSLYTDRRADPGDVLPPGETDRRGWWGDAVSPDPIGSRLWLLDRTPQSSEVLARAQTYAEESLAWLVADRVASRVDVVTEFFASGSLGISVTVHRPSFDPTTYRYGKAWAAEGLGY